MSTVKALKEMCRRKGIKGYSTLRKAALEKLCNPLTRLRCTDQIKQLMRLDKTLTGNARVWNQMKLFSLLYQCSQEGILERRYINDIEFNLDDFHAQVRDGDIPVTPFIKQKWMSFYKDYKPKVKAIYINMPSMQSEYRPFIFRGKPPYLGVELELDFHNDRDMYACKEELQKVASIQIIPELSVPNGFEIVTDPMDIRHQILAWRQILPIVHKHRGHCTMKCGIHIRIDRTKQANINVPLLFNVKNKAMLEVIAKRQENKFCDYSQCAYKSKQTCVNIEDKTMEIRIFRCTVILKNMLSFLLFANAIMTKDAKTIQKTYFKTLLR